MKRSTISKLILPAIGLGLMHKAFSTKLQITRYTINGSKIKDNLRIVYISDLHNNLFGEGQKDLIEVIDSQRPDVVLLGGDIFDTRGSFRSSVDLLRWLGENYETYYVTGNHEYNLPSMKDIQELLMLLNIHYLAGDSVIFSHGKMDIHIHGVEDYRKRRSYNRQLKQVGRRLDPRQYNILLSHRPERVEDYARYPFDLILTGHAHGGQIRLPGIVEGVYAPHQGFQPEYTFGEYELDNGATMIVSRGLGYQHYRAPRVFNQPEVVVIDLEK